MIQQLRVIEALPLLPGDQVSPAPKANGQLGFRLLGQAPVEPDGSFQIQIPADIPVRLQALDRDGLALATCGWVWVKPRENRGCIGCHEDPELIPENRFVSALERPATQLTLPPERRRSVGFREHVLPILATRCALSDCHAGSQTPLELNNPAEGTGSEATVYARLLARNQSGDPRYVDPGQARTSPLVWRILGRDASRPWDAQPPSAPDQAVDIMPPVDAPPLTGLERRALIEWIDLGAQWKLPTMNRSAPPTLPVLDEDEAR
jgi:hypothetical protein